MSRKDEIVKIFKDWELGGCVPCSVYEPIATEIEKLYEGKVEYVVQFYSYQKKWTDNNLSKSNNIKIAKKFKILLKKEFKNNKYRFIKRVTTDQIIEE